MNFKNLLSLPNHYADIFKRLNKMIRTILIPDTQTVTFNVPKEYIGKEVEVIAFAKNEGIDNKESTGKQVSFNALSIDTKNFKFNRNEANER